MSTDTSSFTDAQETTRKTAHAVLWNYLSFGLGKGLVLISTAILARLLTTADYGLVGIALLTISYLAVLKDFGLGAALIQRRDHVEESSNIVFTINFLVAIILTVGTILIAPFVGSYFRNPDVVPLLRVLGFTFILSSLGSVHLIRLQRDLAFNRKLIPDIGSSITKGGVSIGLALAGFGAWALVWGQIAGVIATVVLAWIAYPWRPRFHFQRKLARGLIHFGSFIFMVNVMDAVISNADYLVVGRMLGTEALGIYTLAYRLPELLVLNLLWVVGKAIYPAYASLQNQQPDLLRKGFLTTIRYMGMVSIPLCLGLFVAADPLVRVLFGEQWLEAIPVVRILALYVLFRSIDGDMGSIFRVTGRPKLLAKMSFLGALFLLPALIYGSRYGIAGVAFAHLIIGIGRTLLGLIIALNLIKVRWIQLLQQLKPAMISGFALLLLAVPMTYFTQDLLPIVRLPLIVFAGAVGYLTVLWFLEREQLLEAMQLVFKRNNEK